MSYNPSIKGVHRYEDDKEGNCGLETNRRPQPKTDCVNTNNPTVGTSSPRGHA